MEAVIYIANIFPSLQLNMYMVILMYSDLVISERPEKIFKNIAMISEISFWVVISIIIILLYPDKVVLCKPHKT